MEYNYGLEAGDHHISFLNNNKMLGILRNFQSCVEHAQKRVSDGKISGPKCFDLHFLECVNFFSWPGLLFCSPFSCTRIGTVSLEARKWLLRLFQGPARWRR